MDDSRFWAWLDQFMSAPRARGRLWATLADAATLLACWHITYLFRLGFERWQPGRPWYDDWVSLGVVLTYLASLAAFGVPRGPWRFFGFDDFKRIAVACLLAGLVSAVAVLMAQLVGVARAVLLLHPLFSILALSLTRMLWRMVAENARARAVGIEEERRAIVLGAGEAGRRLVAGIHRRDGWTVLGLLDDDPAKQKQRIGGVPVLGPIERVALPHIRAGATHVIVAMPGASAERRAEVLALARETGLEVLAVPSQAELRAEDAVQQGQRAGP